MPAFWTPLESTVPLKMEVPLRRDVPPRRECPAGEELPLPLCDAPLRSAGVELVVGNVLNNL